MIDLTAGLLVLLFAWKGFRRGLVSALMDVLGLAVGMVAAYLWVNSLGERFLERYPNAGLMAYLAASATIFGCVFLVFQVPSWIFGHRNRKRQSEGRGSAISAWTGAILNGAVGFAYVLGLLWVSMLWIGPGFGSEKDVPFRTPLQRLSGVAMGAVADGFLPATEPHDGLWRGLAQAYSRDPGRATVHLKTFLNHPDVEAVFGGADPGAPVWEEQVRTTHLKKMTRNRPFMDACTQLGMWHPNAGNDQKEILLELYLRELQEQINRLQNVPQVRELMSDPEFQRLAQERNVSAMLRDPRLVSLWQELRSGKNTREKPPSVPPSGSHSRADLTPRSVPFEDQKEKKMYRWRDKDGQVYITNEPPPEGAEEF